MYNLNKKRIIKETIIKFMVAIGGIMSCLSGYFYHANLSYISGGISGITLIILILPEPKEITITPLCPLIINKKDCFIDETSKEYELIKKMEYLHALEIQLIKREQKLNLYIAAELCRPPSTDMIVSGELSSLSSSTASTASLSSSSTPTGSSSYSFSSDSGALDNNV
jgi:hypothetical protein